MNSQLLFRHIKHNILRYTVALSAVVHLLGIFLFPSWGTVSGLVKKKPIQVKFVPKHPDKPVEKKSLESKIKQEREVAKSQKEPAPNNPATRPKSPLVKSAKAVHPALAVKRKPVPVHHTTHISQPVKAIQRDSSLPHPVASIQKMAEMGFSPTHPPSPQMEQPNAPRMASSRALKERKASDSFINSGRIHSASPTRQVTHIAQTSSPLPAVQRKHYSQVALIHRPKTPRATFSESRASITGLKIASAKIASPASLSDNLSVQSPTSKMNVVQENQILNANPLIRSKNTQPPGQGSPTIPTRREISGSGIRVPSPITGIQVQSPQSLDSEISTPGQPALAVAGRHSISPSGATSLLQMALIPSGFTEEIVTEKINTKKASEKNIFSGGNNDISADQMGIIKRAFSSQVRTKIAQSKYYPRMARKRGFEGEPVVAFTLGNTGDLVEVSINNPSSHKLLNEAALDAVKSASPYPPIPKLLKLKTIRFKLPISFILEEP